MQYFPVKYRGAELQGSVKWKHSKQTHSVTFQDEILSRWFNFKKVFSCGSNNFCLFILASIICTAWQHSSLRYKGVQIGWIIEQLKVLQSHDHVHLRGDRQCEECLAWPEEGSVWQLYSFKVLKKSYHKRLDTDLEWKCKICKICKLHRKANYPIIICQNDDFCNHL